MSTLHSFAVFLGILLLITFVVVIWGVVLYNRLVSLRNAVRNGFAQIDVQLTRRYDLIPNLVETVKGYLKHERETLEAVIRARNTAADHLRSAAADPTDGLRIRDLAGAEAALGGLLGRLFALSEAYPDLKASQNMMALQEELTATENRVAFARQAFNDSVMGYNTRRESFPDVLIAGTFGFRPAEFLRIEAEEKREVPQVSFGS
jgi:LemA protein